jgi:hypothetical protein
LPHGTFALATVRATSTIPADTAGRQLRITPPGDTSSERRTVECKDLTDRNQRKKSSFLKKRTKKLLYVSGGAVAACLGPNLGATDKKFFGSFFSKKNFLPFGTQRRR